MAQVIVFHHALGLTRGVIAFADQLRRAGHIVHTPDLLEVWESSKDAGEWFAKYVRPNLPPDIKPQRHVQELHTLIRR